MPLPWADADTRPRRRSPTASSRAKKKSHSIPRTPFCLEGEASFIDAAVTPSLDSLPHALNEGFRDDLAQQLAGMAVDTPPTALVLGAPAPSASPEATPSLRPRPSPAEFSFAATPPPRGSREHRRRPSSPGLPPCPRSPSPDRLLPTPCDASPRRRPPGSVIRHRTAPVSFSDLWEASVAAPASRTLAVPALAPAASWDGAADAGASWGAAPAWPWAAAAAPAPAPRAPVGSLGSLPSHPLSSLGLPPSRDRSRPDSRRSSLASKRRFEASFGMMLDGDDGPRKLSRSPSVKGQGMRSSDDASLGGLGAWADALGAALNSRAVPCSAAGNHEGASGVAGHGRGAPLGLAAWLEHDVRGGGRHKPCPEHGMGGGPGGRGRVGCGRVRSAQPRARGGRQPPPVSPRVGRRLGCLRVLGRRGGPVPLQPSHPPRGPERGRGGGAGGVAGDAGLPGVAVAPVRQHAPPLLLLRGRDGRPALHHRQPGRGHGARRVWEGAAAAGRGDGALFGGAAEARQGEGGGGEHVGRQAMRRGGWGGAAVVLMRLCSCGYRLNGRGGHKCRIA